MNIPNKFDLYLENKLSTGEKNKFERELSEQPELAESYKTYSQINRILETELYSPLLNSEDDPILNELSVSQRLEIEEDVKRYYSNEFESGSAVLFPEGDSNSGDLSASENAFSEKYLATKVLKEKQFVRILNIAAKEKTNGKLKIYKLYIGIAAAVVVSFFAGKIIFGLNTSVHIKISPQEAFAYYYKPNSDNELKSLQFNDTRLRSVFLDSKRSDLNSDEIYLNNMEVSDDDYELSLLYLGIIFIERSEFPEARKCFHRMLTIESAKKINAAFFYLSLAYLSEGEFAQAKPFLNKLTQSKNYYSKKAKDILESVKPS